MDNLRKKPNNKNFIKEKILSDITRKNIERSYRIENTEGTKAHYSSRYGWTLRRTVLEENKL